jgi:hypothetical protein
MAEDLGWEIRLYLNTAPSGTWAQQDVLDEYKSFQFTKVLNQAGSGSIIFDSKSLSPANLALLDRDVFFAFCKPGKYGVDGAATQQGTDICFGILPENITHSIKGPNQHEINISGPGMGEILNRSITLPASYPSLAGVNNRPILSGTPIAVWETLRLESQARNAAGMLAIPWNNFFGGGIISRDSAGVVWDPATFMNIVFEVRAGTGLLDLLKWAYDFGGFNFLIDYQGRNPVQAATFCYQTFRADVSGKVGLHLGRHILSADKTISREATMSDLLGDLDSSATGRPSVFNGDAQFKYGKREFYWTDSTSYNFPDAQAVANKLANSRRAAANTTTLEIAPNIDFRAFIDYDCFDQIIYDNSELGIRGKFTVMGIAVDVSETGERQQVLLETPIETFQRRVYAEVNKDQQTFKYRSKLAP